MHVDFTKENLKVDLPKPFYYKGPRDKEEVLIDSVVLKRLFATEISLIKSKLSKRSAPVEARFLYSAKDWLESGIAGFYAGDTEVRGTPVPALLKKMPNANLFKLFVFSLMLTRGSSYISTHYKCSDPDCGKVTHFNLDPENEIPDEIESDRYLMQDFMDYYKEHVDNLGLRDFEFTPKSSKLVLYHDVTDAEGKITREPMSVNKLRFNFPTVGGYLSALGDSSKAPQVELWAFYSAIVGINDLDEAETRKLKETNNFNDIFRLSPSDYSAMLEAGSKFGVEIDHSYECPFCGEVIEVPFDMTNFFDSLTS
jgi:hypothetical protein